MSGIQASRSSQQHEAGDRVFVISQNLSDHVSKHPYVSGSPELAELAEIAEKALAELYQAIWRESE